MNKYLEEITPRLTKGQKLIVEMTQWVPVLPLRPVIFKH